MWTYAAGLAWIHQRLCIGWLTFTLAIVCFICWGARPGMTTTHRKETYRHQRVKVLFRHSTYEFNTSCCRNSCNLTPAILQSVLGAFMWHRHRILVGPFSSLVGAAPILLEYWVFLSTAQCQVSGSFVMAFERFINAIYLSSFLSVCLSPSLFISLFFHPSICPTPSACLSVCPFQFLIVSLDVVLFPMALTLWPEIDRCPPLSTLRTDLGESCCSKTLHLPRYNGLWNKTRDSMEENFRFLIFLLPIPSSGCDQAGALPSTTGLIINSIDLSTSSRVNFIQLVRSSWT